MKRRAGFTLVQLLVVVGVLSAIACLTIPALQTSRRQSNERTASTVLKTLSSAEADFRANDRDGNQVNDFWTGDVKGLYTMTSCVVRGAADGGPDPSIRLIDLGVAAADVDGRHVPAGGENAPLSRFASPAPHAGYWYVALVADLTVPPGDPGREYRADTGGVVPMGKCHHSSKFGFFSLPASSWSGKYVFMVNENNSLFRRALSGPLWMSGGVPPGLESVPADYVNWPSDETLRSYCNRAG